MELSVCEPPFLSLSLQPTVLPSSTAFQLDPASLSGADEGLADLQPEPEEEGEERRGGWEGLIEEQKVHKSLHGSRILINALHLVRILYRSWSTWRVLV